jgi:hypothetical protein
VRRKVSLLSRALFWHRCGDGARLLAVEACIPWELDYSDDSEVIAREQLLSRLLLANHGGGPIGWLEWDPSLWYVAAICRERANASANAEEAG